MLKLFDMELKPIECSFPNGEILNKVDVMKQAIAGVAPSSVS